MKRIENDRYLCGSSFTETAALDYDRRWQPKQKQAKHTSSLGECANRSGNCLWASSLQL